MLAKERMIHLLKTTKIDEEYRFEFDGNPAEARDYIHRMRVELSRMRDAVKARGNVISHFKILVVDIVFDLPKQKTTVKLLRTKTLSNVDNQVLEIFSELSAGKKLSNKEATT